MPFTIFLDETGSSSLKDISTNYPCFGLMIIICDQAEYIHTIVPKVVQLKYDFCMHEGVILHSREIRRRMDDFAFLNNPELRIRFMQRVDDLMGSSKYHIIATVIDKALHKKTYGAYAEDPYKLSVHFALERLHRFLKRNGQTEAVILAEARGRKEDRDLRQVFDNLLRTGTRYESFSGIKYSLQFVTKARNIIGMQFADLVAYPIVRYAQSKKASATYDILRPRLEAVKIFPESF